MYATELHFRTLAALQHTLKMRTDTQCGVLGCGMDLLVCLCGFMCRLYL